MPKIFIITIFLLSFSVFAKAQAQMNYHYLEVIDSNKKPIPDAKVEVWAYSYKSENLQTDLNGGVRIGVLYPSGLRPLASVFTITKPDYFPFYDFGLVFERLDYRSIKIELFRIPKTDKERKALGKEQLKRDFITAVHKGDIDAVRRLIESGISPNLTTKDLKGISIERGVESTPAIVFPIILGHGAVVKLLLEKRANLPKPSNKDNPYRIDVNSSNALFYYLNADYDTRTYDIQDEKERAKLFERIERERNEGLKALIKAGANINKSAYSTPLIISFDKGYIGAAKILIESGAEVNAKDDEGNTALMSAVKEGLIDGVKLLIEKGADVNLKDRGGITALSYAKAGQSYQQDKTKYKEIIKLLEGAGAK